VNRDRVPVSVLYLSLTEASETKSVQNSNLV